MEATASRVASLEAALLDFDRAVRSAALDDLLALAGRGEPALPAPADVANMHIHTFFSFNAYGHSPTSLAWLARRRGLKLAGVVDFDVLDGVDEFLDACDRAGVRASAGIETRVFVPEHVAGEINSPGEPGVAYQMGIGVTTGTVPAGVAGDLVDLRRRAGERNRAVVERVNAYLAPVTVDYERDVVPLTPAGNPTERHIVVAYVRAAERAAPDPAAWWAGKLGVAPGEMAATAHDPARLQNLVRARLMKQGGPGYVRPESGMFPTLRDFFRMIAALGALPCVAWLDGTSAAEQDAGAWLEFMIGQGALALNIIPDRNWNLPDVEARRAKVRNLHRVVEAAREMDLPINVGTEMNSFGQKVVDDFDAAELAPVRAAFLDGAHVVYGHTAMQRALGLGYASDWARTCLPTRRERNAFYAQIGRAVPPGKAALHRLSVLGPEPAPGDVLAHVARMG